MAYSMLPSLLQLFVLAAAVILSFVAGRLANETKSRRQRQKDAQKLGNKQHIKVGPPYQLVQGRCGWLLANGNDAYLGRAIIEYGEYSRDEFLLLAGLLNVRPGAVVEVGANAGFLTVPIAQVLATAKRDMIAFEPQPFLFQNLCANLALNGLENVRTWPWACGTKQATLHFPVQSYTTPGNFGGVSMQDGVSNTSIAVPCVRLDDVIGSSPISLIKIDVEGAELEVLQGANAVIAASRPVIYLENDRPDKSRALIEWLQQNNYRLWWHVTALFHADNFFGVQANLYGNLHSFNMLCLPREIDMPELSLTEITDPTWHPLSETQTKA